MNDKIAILSSGFAPLVLTLGDILTYTYMVILIISILITLIIPLIKNKSTKESLTDSLDTLQVILTLCRGIKNFNELSHTDKVNKVKQILGEDFDTDLIENAINKIEEVAK